MNKAPVSLVVLTYNDEVHVAHTLESAKDWVGEIIIVDSFSTDRTLEICARYTDRIYQHKFVNHAAQFNWAIDCIPINYPWVLRLDSDEMVTPELAAEVSETLPTLSEDVAGVYLRRRVYFMGRWMKHGGYYPKWFLRLFRKGTGRYEEVTEEHIVLSSGRAIRLTYDFIDYNRKDLSFWVDKHNHWAIGEMMDTMSAMGRGELPEGTVKPDLFGTQEQQVRWLKHNVYAQFPLFVRAWLYFLYRYTLQMGFLDGIEGLIFHFLQGCWYRFLVDAKIYEAEKFGVSQAEMSRRYSGSKPWEHLMREQKAEPTAHRPDK